MAVLTRLPTVTTALAVAGALLLDVRPAAQTEGEQVIKAAYLYNFTKFINWPASAFPDADTPFTVCVFAEPAFQEHVVAIMEGEQVGGRPVTVVRSRSPDQVTTCHMAYFSRPEAERIDRRLSALGELPILTIGEGERFMGMGGHIAFHLEHDRVRFVISQQRAEAAGLHISSKLLRVAKRVE
jgi:hypothetical protein